MKYSSFVLLKGAEENLNSFKQDKNTLNKDYEELSSKYIKTKAENKKLQIILRNLEKYQPNHNIEQDFENSQNKLLTLHIEKLDIENEWEKDKNEIVNLKQQINEISEISQRTEYLIPKHESEQKSLKKNYKQVNFNTHCDKKKSI